MGTCGTGETLPVRTIERDRVELPLRRTRFRGSEQDALPRLIDAVYRRHLPIATGKLILQCTVDAVKIEMPEAGALAGPEETLAFAEEPWFPKNVDPLGILFVKHHA